MRTIGMLGGMSWESSAEYYKIINEEVRRRLGGTHSAKSVMFSVDFHEVETLQHQGDWEGATAMMVAGARAVEAGGGGCLVICTNTMHRMADEVQAAIGIPLIHIADATAAAVKQAGVGTVALLGTRFTMEEEFYRGRLDHAHGLTVQVPDAVGRAAVHDVIYDELVQGVIEDESRTRFVDIINQLVADGAEGVIAGCTEIELLVEPHHVSVPYFPTTRLHALAAVDWALDAPENPGA
jgi:aspartate racemase